MQTIDRILVATSFSERSADAVRKAAALAAERDATLTLLHVVEPVKNRRVRRLVNQGMLVRARVADARRKLATLAGEIAARQGVPVELCVEVGEKMTSILAACQETDLLMIGGTAGRFAALIQRPIVERLLGRCDAPILVVNGPQCLRHARALVVIRDAPGAVSALRATGCLWPAAEKVIFYAVDPRLRRSRQTIEPSSSRAIDSPRRRAQIVGFLKGLVRRAGLRVHDVSCRFRYGDACQAALSLQSEVQADVMVLTRNGSSPPSTDFVLDKTATRLLALAPCDVLITAVSASKPVTLALPHSKLAA